MAPDPLQYQSASIPPQRVPPTANPAAGISGCVVSLMTVGVFFLSAFIARYSPAGVLLMASVFALWPLGFVLSIMGLTRPGARALAGIGLAVSVGGAWIVVAAVVKILKGGI